jgi:methionine synthase II (cobalamin-independent)
MADKLHQRPPFRAEHVGSLLRPESLLKMRQAVEAGKASAADLKKEEDQAIDDIIALQLKNGYHAITDGEYRRHSTSTTCAAPSLHV